MTTATDTTTLTALDEPNIIERHTYYTLEVCYYDIERTEHGDLVRRTEPKVKRFTHLHDMDEVRAYAIREKRRDSVPERMYHSAANHDTDVSVWTRHYCYMWAVRETAFSIEF